MNAIGAPPASLLGNQPSLSLSLAARTFARGCGLILRFAVLAILYPFALADGLWQPVAAAPTGTALAGARAAWLHRWSRVTRGVLGWRLNHHGYVPVSGVVAANFTGIRGAILLAAVRPCVFVAGADVRRWPFIGLLARLAGTIFVDRQRHDAVRVNFMIQRAVQHRRLLVVIFPECRRSHNNATPGQFTSALFQPVVDLGCTLTAAAISRGHPKCHGTKITFSAPAFRRGSRKQLARLLRREVLGLGLHSKPSTA
ncbi:MAG: 1-acyl-sn-glycerol-3-phosphate acyltransferase [Chthoniobacter sp.]|uniref:lysophospholipid acyltransferase family protein n=1 Tax=Chthoniobacter sp. TaxID=2510640 RepID=UPI0032A617EF